MARTDLFYAHVGGIDTLARSLLVAADMVEHGDLERHRAERYAGWSNALGQSILSGGASLEELNRRVLAGEIDPQPVSGRQEFLENVVNQRIWATDRIVRAPAESHR